MQNEQKSPSFVVDAFTSDSVGTRFPENTWDANSVEEVARMLHNCSRKIAGIRMIQVWINELHEEDPISEEHGKETS